MHDAAPQDALHLVEQLERVGAVLEVDRPGLGHGRLGLGGARDDRQIADPVEVRRHDAVQPGEHRITRHGVELGATHRQVIATPWSPGSP